MTDFLSQLEEEARQRDIESQRQRAEGERRAKDPQVIAEREKERSWNALVQESLLKYCRYAERVKELAPVSSLYVNQSNWGTEKNPNYGKLEVYVHKGNRFEIDYEKENKRFKVTCISRTHPIFNDPKDYIKQMYFSVTELNDTEMGKLMEWVIGKNELYSEPNTAPIKYTGCLLVVIILVIVAYVIISTIIGWFR